MKYCRINLSQTNYTLSTHAYVMTDKPVEQLKAIFKSYCEYKKFDGIMPIFDSQYIDPSNTVIGYSSNNKLVAFSLIRRYDEDNAESIQFAWDYKEPKLRLGIASLETECALFKEMGYKYLYLGPVEEYKKKFNGYEEIGVALFNSN